MPSLAAAGAPEDLVQIVTGYGDTGAALVRSGPGKLIFVGSTEVGRRVLAASAETLTPVTMELGGKDAFVVTDDVDLRQVTPVFEVDAVRLGLGNHCRPGAAAAARIRVRVRVR